MNIRLRRIDKSIPLPEHKTSGAAGFDLCAREQVTILAHNVGAVPLNVAIEPPTGYFVLLAARSSLYKRGLTPANGVGIIDCDYSGNDDEYHAILRNMTDVPVTIEKGERIMQGVIIPHARAEWNEVDDMGNKNRGGFGTTGRK